MFGSSLWTHDALHGDVRNLDISETSIFAFAEALLECVELQVMDWEGSKVERVMLHLSDLTTYIGRVIAKVKASGSEVQALLKSSWIQAQERNMQPTSPTGNEAGKRHLLHVFSGCHII